MNDGLPFRVKYRRANENQNAFRIVIDKYAEEEKKEETKSPAHVTAPSEDVPNLFYMTFRDEH